MVKNKKLTNKQLLQAAEKRIKLGEIKIDEDSYEQAIGLSCQDYKFRFPDSWDYPQCYRIVVDLEGQRINDKEWLKEFAESLKKGIQQSEPQKTSSHGWVSEIVCTQEDIGEPHSQNKKEVKK